MEREGSMNAIKLLIEDLKAANKGRAVLMARGSWTRQEMERANARILSIQQQIDVLRAS